MQAPDTGNYYCQSRQSFEQCCRYLDGAEPTPTPEALMRSRYTAFALGDIDYLMKSWRHSQGLREQTEKWVTEHDWIGLQVMQCRQGGEQQKQGSVEFIAYYRPKGSQERLAHHELSNFERIDGSWFYLDGDTPKGAPKKTGRNDPCPCGSGKKFKRCCF